MSTKGAQNVTVKPSGCEFDPPLEEMKYLFKFLFPFLRSGVEAKCGVSSTTPESGGKWGTECLRHSVPLLRSPCLHCLIQREADKNINYSD